MSSNNNGSRFTLWRNSSGPDATGARGTVPTRAASRSESAPPKSLGATTTDDVKWNSFLEKAGITIGLLTATYCARKRTLWPIVYGCVTVSLGGVWDEELKKWVEERK